MEKTEVTGELETIYQLLNNEAGEVSYYNREGTGGVKKTERTRLRGQ